MEKPCKIKAAAQRNRGKRLCFPAQTNAILKKIQHTEQTGESEDSCFRWLLMELRTRMTRRFMTWLLSPIPPPEILFRRYEDHRIRRSGGPAPVR